MTDVIPMQGGFYAANPADNLIEENLVTEPLDPLDLSIEDDELIPIIDKRIRNSRNFYANSYNLYDRRKKNETYFFGRQVLEKEKENLYKTYESKYMDNVLYEIGYTLKPLAMSRLPDLLVLPGNDSEEAKLMAEEIGKAVDTQIKEQDNRYVLGLAFLHRPVYFTGVIKCYWNPELDDYVFDCIHPDYIDVDHTCPNNNADNMQFVSQRVPATLEEVVMRFPGKKQEFLDEVKKQGVQAGDNYSWKSMATTVEYREIWFTWYKKHSDAEWERVEGVMWKYHDVILKKMKNPTYDYEGEERYFAWDDREDDNTKRALNEMEVQQVLMSGVLPDNVESEQVYHNYFRMPRKPFFFMSYDKWGKQPFDETSWIEQNLQMQASLDKRGKQIEETLDKRGHNVFSKESGLTPQDVEELDMNDPDQDLVVDGNVNNTHKFIPPERPTQQEFAEMTNIRDRMYGSSGSNATRGELKNTAATNNQIAREDNYTRADDTVEETINAAAQWMAEWAMQMIKLRYTAEHFKWILGVAGKMVWLKLNRNMVDQGMIVKIKASGTDKLRAQNNAMDMAKMQMIDPYTFFVDMGLSDPEGRTEKLILMKADPVAYLQKVVKGINTSEAMAQALMNAELPQQQPVQPPTMTGAPPMNEQTPAGQPPMANGQQNPSPQNTSAVPAMPPMGAPQGSPRMM